MTPEWDLEWLAELAFLAPGGRGELVVVHDQPVSPVSLPLASGLPVTAAGIPRISTVGPHRAVFARFASKAPDPVRFSKQCARITSGPIAVRLECATPDSRECWDRAFLSHGFRRHPLVLSGAPFASLETETRSCLLAYLPQFPDEIRRFPDSILAVERNLHMDMLREAGRRSDAHLARYTWAAGFIRPYDIVVDAACGLGYGAAILACGTRCGNVRGFDNSEFAVHYAESVYGCQYPRTSFSRRDLGEPLPLADASVDCVVSFETLEHLENPQFFVEEVRRVLKPGGRLLCSVPNRWVDDTGRDPSPYHRHVFDLQKLAGLCKGYRIEQAVAQCAGGSDPRFSSRRRLELFDQLPVDTDPATKGVEWWLLAAMKDPVEAGAVPYNETVFPALEIPNAARLKFSSGYRNPWLAHSMVHAPFRLKSPSELTKLAKQVGEAEPAGSADRGAALTVLAYQALANPRRNPRAVARLVAEIRSHLAVAPSAPHEHRWKISLSFAAAQLLLASGHRALARAQFMACAKMDFRVFSPHIATKTTEAAFMAGKLAFLDGDHAAARRAWQRGLAIGRDLLGVHLEEILIAPDQPHVFGIGDGMREFTLAFDNVTRCANGMHVLAEGKKLGQSRLGDLENSWQRAEATNQHFVDTIEEQGTHIRRLQSMHSEAEEHLATERAAAAHAARDAQGHIDALKAQLDELASTSRQQAKHIAVLERERVRLAAEADAAKVQANRAAQEGQEHIDELNAQLDKVAATCRDQAGFIEVLTNERDRLASSEQTLSQTLANTRAESQGHIDRLRAQLENSETRHAALVDDLKAQLDKVAASGREQTGFIEVLTKERDRLASREKALTEQLAAARAEGQGHIRKLTKQLEQQSSESQSHIDRLRAQLEDSQKRHATLVDNLNAHLDQVAAACRDQAGYIEVLSKERDRLVAAEKSLDEALAHARAEGQRHIKKLAKQLDQQSAESQGHIDRLRAQLEGAEKRHSELVQELKTNLDQVAAACRDQAGYIEALIKERDRLAALEQEMKTKESDYLKVIAEQTVYLRQLESLRDKHDG